MKLDLSIKQAKSVVITTEARVFTSGLKIESSLRKIKNPNQCLMG